MAERSTAAATSNRDGHRDGRHDDSNGALHAASPRALEPTVVSTKVVSPKGSRVTEQVIVLSERAAARLEIKGRVPAR